MMKRISSTASEFARFAIPPAIALFAAILFSNAPSNAAPISWTVVGVLFLTMISVTYYSKIFKANEVWMSADFIVVKKWSSEEKIKLCDITKVTTKRTHQGSPIYLTIKDHEGIFFYPKSIFFPFKKSSISKELQRLVSANKVQSSIQKAR